MGLIAKTESKRQNHLEDICPNFLDTSNPQFMLLDNMYVASLLISSYEKEMEGGFLEKLLHVGVDMQVSLYFHKHMRQEVIKKITYQIGNTGATMKGTFENQIDQSIMYKTYEDAKMMKEKMLIDGEELFDLSIYLIVYASSLHKLQESMQKVENMASGCGLTSNRAYFKQEKAFMSGMPLMEESPLLQTITHRNALTEGICSAYPFISNELCDDEGIFMGTNLKGHSLILLDRFDSRKYSNANMFVIGTSGSGKSYFSKLMIIRNFYQGITQYIIDPDREYQKLCKKLHGTTIDFQTNMINVMDIRESSKEGEGSYLETKLRKLRVFFSILFPNMLPEELSLLEEHLIKVYEQKGITFDDQSLFSSHHHFKEKTEMPRLSDVYERLQKDKRMKKYALLLKPYVLGSLKFFNAYTNVDLENTIVVTDVYGVEEKDLPAVLMLATDYYWDRIKQNRGQKKILYLDEVWKLINQNHGTADFVFKLFKTIRKYGGAATAITQDMSDFFSLEEGKYGKSILSNASLKCIFPLEENECQSLEKIMSITTQEKNMLRHFNRGECLLYAGREHVALKVEASELEHAFITTDRKDLAEMKS